MRRCATGMAGVLVTLAFALPAAAQGKSGQAHGKKPAAPPPTTTTRPSSAPAPASADAVAGGPVILSGTPAAPFAWMDDANLMAPGTVWLGVSMVSWHGGGVREVIAPVFDGSVGITPRVQLGASVPRVSGGLGTSFYTAKIAIFNDDTYGVKLAIGPTLEVLGPASMQYGPAGQSRTQWGLPVSAEIERGVTRMYGSSGYFSPGIWYAGVAMARPVAGRIGVSASFSRAWTRTASEAALGTGTSRNDLSGGASYALTPNVALYGSLGRTVATAVEDGGGTTLSFGLSLSAGPVMFTR